MKKLCIHIFFLLFAAFNANAQIWNTWMFGEGGGLDFHYDPPHFIETPFNCPWGVGFISISMCDSSGDFLFYFDGNKVYNSKSEVVENGDTFKIDDFVNPNGTLVLPFPNQKYWIIYQPRSLRPLYSYYMVLDMKANNGEGKVLTKDNCINKHTFDGGDYSATAISENKEFYWLVSKIGVDSFFIYKIDSNNIQLKQKKYFNKYGLSSSFKYSSYKHSINFSHDQKTMVECFMGRSDSLNKAYGSIIFYDFNDQSGQLSNMRVKYYTVNYDEGKFVDAEFSPNDSFIYITGREKIYQFERYAKDFFGSAQIYNTPSNLMPYSIELGPDGKIYSPSHNHKYMHIFNYPNRKGEEAGWVTKEMDYGGESNSLPNIFYQNMKLDYIYINSCYRKTLRAIYDSNNYSKATWFLPTGDSIPGKILKLELPESGRFLIKYKAENDYGYIKWFTDSITYIRKPTANFSTDSTTGCQWLKFKFYDATENDTVHPVFGESWLWDFGDGTTDTVQNPVHIYTKSGNFTIKLIYSNGFCADTIEKKQEVRIIEAPKPGFKMNQENFCSPFTLEITDASLGKVSKYQYSFGDGSTSNLPSPSHLYSEKGDYKIMQTLTGPTGCVTKDSAILHLKKGFIGNEEINALTTVVYNNDSILVNWNKHKDAGFYQLYKKTGNTGFNIAETLADSFYFDTKASPTEHIYTYKINGLDSCQRPSADSRILKNILLKGESIENELAILNWNPFELWQQGVKGYVIEYKNTNGEFVELFDLQNNTYEDKGFFDEDLEFEKCYRIKAIEEEGNKQQSLSNVLCIPYKSVVFMPSAFTPNNDGINDMFAPKGVSIEKMNFKVFDRWGQKLFESSSMEKGWDGTYKGTPCPMENYYYHITIVTGNGEKESFTGLVALVR
jgi:gliding motility-associated-like protein